MDTLLLEAKKFLINHIRDKTIEYETIHPWRSSWEFIVLHSMRVENYVNEILMGEDHNLSQEEVLTIRLAAILHDIGRIEDKEGHALVGKNIVSEWLNKNSHIVDRINSKEMLLNLIMKHSNKHEVENDFSLKVLIDADILDEIGAMSIFMASNWIDRRDPNFFKLLLERVENNEIAFCNKGFELLNTDTAKWILEKKKGFIDQFAQQLRSELCGQTLFEDTEIGQLQ